MLSRFSLASAAVLSITLLGCASPPPRPSGAVLPLDGGRYQSTVKRADQAAAFQTMMRDAEITCTAPTTGSRMPWDPKPVPGKFTVISQTVKDKEGKQIKADNKNLEAGIAVGMKYAGLNEKDSVEVTTIFRCQ